MTRLLYVVGVPGIGKTAAVECVPVGEPEVVARPFAHRRYPDGLLLLGPRRAPFGGTDGLSMGVQPRVVEWLATLPDGARVLGEGDRLATLSFLHAATDAADVLVVHLVADPAIAAQRRRARAEEHGLDPQNPAWLKGRYTKTERLAEQWQVERRRYVRVDAAAPADQVAAAVRATAASFFS